LPAGLVFLAKPCCVEQGNEQWRSYMPGFGAVQALFDNFLRKIAHSGPIPKSFLASPPVLRFNAENNNYT
jgi:hypothetical protein